MPRFGNGVLTVVPTPFLPDGEIDLVSLERLTSFLVDAGVDGLLILGVLGEAPKLVGTERARIVECVLGRVAGRIPVVVGTSHPSAIGARQLSEAAVSMGAAAVMVSPPKLPRTDPTTLAEYFAAVSDGLDADIVLQDHPASSGVVLSPEAIVELCRKVPGIRHVKLEDPPTPQKVSELRRLGCESSLYGGLGGVFFLEELRRGAVGTMTGFAFPEILLQVHRAHRMGDSLRSSEVFYRYLPLIRFEAQEEVGLAIRKRIYRLRGAIDWDHLRPPGRQLDEETAQELKELLASLELPTERAVWRAHA